MTAGSAPSEDALITALCARLPGIEMYTNLNLAVPQPCPPISAIQLAEIEDNMGVSLPPLLGRIYTEVGNGGFGPGYGVLGLGPTGFPDDLGSTADQCYLLNCRKDPSLPVWHWPKTLVPICHYGCAMYDCVDTTTGSMIAFEPNTWDQRSSPRNALFDLKIDLHGWLCMWLDGFSPHDLLFDRKSGRLLLEPMGPLRKPMKRKNNLKLNGEPRQTDLFGDT